MAGYFVQMYCPQGLVRYENTEYGKNQDTGGMVKYILSLVDALCAREEIGRVEIITRKISDPTVSSMYTHTIEQICEKARIVRIECAGGEYLRREKLWPVLDEFTRNALAYIRSGETPDFIHGHGAEGVYITNKLGSILKVPQIVTFHSLGRVRKSWIEDHNPDKQQVLDKYNILQQIEAEEQALAQAHTIIASSKMEVHKQFSLYSTPTDERIRVIPPGVNTDIYYPYYRSAIQEKTSRVESEQLTYKVNQELERFLCDPGKPLIVSSGRAVKSNNFEAIIEAYAGDRELQAMANLAILAGSRSEVSKMDGHGRIILTRLLLLMDKYDLYGKFALPKKNDPFTQIPEIFRFAARSGGVYINANSTESLGGTLLEATASGLPIIGSTESGSEEFISQCKNGLNVSMDSPKSIADTIKRIIGNEERWMNFSNQGIYYLNQKYSWDQHAAEYLDAISRVEGKSAPRISQSLFVRQTNH